MPSTNVGRSELTNARNRSVCPRCRGKKVLAGRIFGENRIVQCHVCKGYGTVPFASVDPTKDYRDDLVKKTLDAAQGRLF
jgi:hypothetical protein